MNPVRNTNLKKMSKKALIRELAATQEDYLELFRQVNYLRRENTLNFARLAAVIAAAGGEVTVTREDLDQLPEDLSQAQIDIEEVDEDTRIFRLAGQE